MEQKNAILQSILPYSAIVGQEQLKLALELAFVAPRLGGVLISGRRGTAKSTTVRAFASMMYADLPVTIPINATEDRVVGSWQIQKLLAGEPMKQAGLLEQAADKLLYIDEVNLLDDHIVNIILDVASTGKLIIQREGLDEKLDIQFTLVGTMNPEEGSLRPQLLDRFGLMVHVDGLHQRTERKKVLQTILQFDQALQEEKQGGISAFLQREREKTAQQRVKIERAKDMFGLVSLSEEVAEACVSLTEGFEVEGHRADYLLAFAARANAALQQEEVTTLQHLKEVAELVLRHRIPGAAQFHDVQWTDEQQDRVLELIENA